MRVHHEKERWGEFTIRKSNDKELTFHLHVDKLYKKLSQRIGILKKKRHCLQIKHMVIFYNAIIRRVMDYVSVIW